MQQAESPHTFAVPTLLVVEDESVVAMDIDDQLHDMGYRVCGCVDNGRDAIARAPTGPT